MRSPRPHHPLTLASAAASCVPWLLGGCGGEADDPGAGPERPATSGDHAGDAWFVEEAAERGLVFAARSGHREGVFYMPEVTVGGAALIDLDLDGDLDAYLTQGGSLHADADPAPGNALFENVGGGHFRDVSAASGADHRGYGMGVASGDADGDGDPDLFVTNLGPDVLLENRGGLRFADVTAAAGVGHPGWGTSAAFFDADRDGDLDLFVCNYLYWTIETHVECYSPVGGRDYCGPVAIDRPTPDLLYRNEGDGRFRDVSREAGIADALGTGLGVAPADYDDDGWTDLFVANDGWEDRLWMNQRDGRFADRALVHGLSVDEHGAKTAGMGAAATDVDDDGDIDVFVCNLSGEKDGVFRNEGGYFVNATAPSGVGIVSRRFTRFGLGLVDFDQDGHLDLYEANGRVKVEDRPWSASDPYAEPNLLFRGLGGMRFAEVLPRGGTAEPLIATSRAAAFGDVDGDGAIDVLVVNKDAPASLLVNRAPARGHWLLLRVQDERGRDAYGARVTLALGDRRLTREVASAWSFQAANDPRVHVGLGALDAVLGVRVRWVDGEVEDFGAPAVDRVHVLRRGAGEPVPKR
jgi:hypothetical protein